MITKFIDFYSNSKIKYLYYRKDGKIVSFKMWDENGLTKNNLFIINHYISDKELQEKIELAVKTDHFYDEVVDQHIFNPEAVNRQFTSFNASVGQVQFMRWSSSAEYNIPRGIRLSDSNRNIFYTTEDATIPSEQEQSRIIPIMSQGIGENFNVAAHTINIILDPIQSDVAVTNPEPTRGWRYSEYNTS